MRIWITFNLYNTGYFTMSTQAARAILRDSLQTLTSDISNYDTNLPLAQESIGQFGRAVVSDIQVDPTISVHSLISPELDSTRFEPLKNEIWNFFLKRSDRRTDKFAISTNNGVFILDATTGQLLGSVPQRPTRGRWYNRMFWYDGSLWFQDNTSVYRLDVDTLEILSTQPVSSGDGYGVLQKGQYIHVGNKWHTFVNGVLVETDDLPSGNQPRSSGSSFAGYHYFPIDSEYNVMLLGTTNGSASVTVIDNAFEDVRRLPSGWGTTSSASVDLFTHGNIFISRASRTNDTPAAYLVNPDITEHKTLAASFGIGVIGRDDLVYSYNRGKGTIVVHQVNGYDDITSSIESYPNVLLQGTNPNVVYYSEDDYLYYLQGSLITKVDPVDMSIIYSINTADEGITGTPSGFSLLRPQGGLNYIMSLNK